LPDSEDNPNQTEDAELEAAREALAAVEAGGGAGLAPVLNRMGSVHQRRGEYDSALEFHGRALASAEIGRAHV